MVPGPLALQPPGRADPGQPGADDQHVDVFGHGAQLRSSGPPRQLVSARHVIYPCATWSRWSAPPGCAACRPLVDRLGGDGAGLLARFRHPAGRAGQRRRGDPRRPPPARVLETAAAELACPDLGLRLAGQQNAAVLGPLAIAIENSPTFGDALDTASRFLFVHSPALTVAQVPDPSGRPGVVGMRYAGTEAEPLPPQVADLGLGLLHRIIVLLHGGGYGLRSVHLPHPPLAPVARYTGFFGADVRFDRPDAVLRVPAGARRHRGARRQPGAARGRAGLHAPATSRRPGRPSPTGCACCSTQSLGSAPVGIGAIARLLRTHPRTLQRRLAAEGTTFEAILDDVRRDRRAPADHPDRPAVRPRSPRWSAWPSSPR